jgi:hypothetical protein
MSDVGLPIAAVAVALGVAACFAGQRLFGFLLSLAGFAAGFALASTIAPLFMDGPDPLVILAAGLIAGLAGAFLVRAFFNASVLLAFAAVGGWLGIMAAAAMHAEHLALPAAALGSVIASVSAAVLRAPRWLVIGVTSVAGAAAIVLGGSVALGRWDADPIGSAMASAGAVVDPSQPLPLLILSVLSGRWIEPLTRPIELIAAQPLLLVAIASIAAVGVLVQAAPRGLVARPRMLRSV